MSKKWKNYYYADRKKGLRKLLRYIKNDLRYLKMNTLILFFFSYFFSFFFSFSFD